MSSLSNSSRLRLAIAVFIAVLSASTLGVAVTKGSDAPAEATDLGAAFGAEARDLAQPVATTTAATTPIPLVVPETTTTVAEPIVAPTTTRYVAPQPLAPDPMPSNPYAATAQVVLGTLEIPKLNVVAQLQEGITLTAINRGPGHWPGTPMPGGQGNMVIAGHRTTYSKPFANIDQLVAGDQVIFRMPNGPVVYVVRGVIVVPAQNIGIAAQSFAHTGTLFACHPRGSATHRIVAKLALLGPDGRTVDNEADMPPVSQGSNPVTDTTLLVKANGAPGAPTADPFSGSGG